MAVTRFQKGNQNGNTNSNDGGGQNVSPDTSGNQSNINLPGLDRGADSNGAQNTIQDNSAAQAAEATRQAQINENKRRANEQERLAASQEAARNRQTKQPTTPASFTPVEALNTQQTKFEFGVNPDVSPVQQQQQQQAEQVEETNSPVTPDVQEGFDAIAMVNETPQYINSQTGEIRPEYPGDANGLNPSAETAIEYGAEVIEPGEQQVAMPDALESSVDGYVDSIKETAQTDVDELEDLLNDQSYTYSRRDTEPEYGEGFDYGFEAGVQYASQQEETPVANPETPADLTDSDIQEGEERPASKREASIQNIQAWLTHGFFKTTEVDGSIHPALQEELNSSMDFFALEAGEEHFLWEAVSHELGLTPDVSDMLFLEGKSREVRVDYQEIIKALKSIKRKVASKNVRQPFAYTNKAYKYKSVYRFTIPLVRDELAVALANGRPGNQCQLTPKEIQDFGKQHWPIVKDAILQKGNADQAVVLMDMVDAVERANGTSYNYTGRLPGMDSTVDQVLDSYRKEYVGIVEDPTALEESNDQVRETANMYAEQIARRGVKKVQTSDGNFIYVQDVKQNGIQWALRSIVKLGRANGIIADVALTLSSAGERILGNVTNKLAASLMGAAYRIDPPTTATREIARSNEVIDAVNDAIRAELIDRPGLNNFLASGGVLGNKRASTAVSQMLNPGSQDTRNTAMKKIDRALDVYSDIAGESATGLFILKGADAQRFIDFLYINLSKAEGSTITPESFEALMTDNPVAAISEFLQRPEGHDALLQAMDTTVNSKNIYGEKFNDAMRKSAIGEFAVAAGISKYFNYGLQLQGKLVPLSHTITYLGTRKYAETARGQETQAQNLTVGGNDSFWNGLAQNLIIDAAWMGTRAGMFMIFNALLAALGVDPPDDDEGDGNKEGIYGEWKVGSNIFGEGNGIAIKENWMFRDLFGFITPAAMATQIAMQRGLDDPTWWNVFVDGCNDAWNGLPFIELSEIAQTITHFDENIINAQNEITDAWGDDAPSAAEYTTTKATTWGMKMLSSFLEPRVIRSVYGESSIFNQGALAHSKTQIFTPTIEDDDTRTTRTTWSDSELRRVSYNSPLISLINNLTQGVYADDGTQKTGYFKNEMPLVTTSDPIQMSWLGENSPFYLPENATDEERDAVANNVIDLLSKGWSTEQMSLLGIALPYEARATTVTYLKACRDEAWNIYNERLATPGEFSNNGNSWETNKALKNEAYNATKAQTDYYTSLIDKLYDNTIPTEIDTYNRWETNYKAAYYWEDGSPANAIDYKLSQLPGGAQNVTQEWYATGDHKSSFNPFLAVDDRYGTYDNQTPSSFYDADSIETQFGDNESYMSVLEELYGDRTITSGMFSGENAYDLLSAGGQSDTPLYGSRAFVPTTKTYDDLSGLKQNTATDDSTSSGSGSSSSYGGSGGYSRSSGGGGGGSSYSPNIYSRPAYSLNASKPATMYAKNPTSARFDYLRPGFETKGSRTSNKRQDI